LGRRKQPIEEKGKERGVDREISTDRVMGTWRAQCPKEPGGDQSRQTDWLEKNSEGGGQKGGSDPCAGENSEAKPLPTLHRLKKLGNAVSPAMGRGESEQTKWWTTLAREQRDPSYFSRHRFFDGRGARGGEKLGA